MLFDRKLASVAANLRARHDIPIELTLWNGQTYPLGDRPRVKLHVPCASSAGWLINTDLMKLGEAYVEGHIDVQGRLSDIFEAAEKLARAGGKAQGRLLDFAARLKHTRARDKRAIEYHYDVSNEFYRLFLDRRMVYSCAYYRSSEDTLEQAQLNKLDHILTKLQVRPGHRFLDIGCGWGAMIVRAAKHYGAQATGVTLSERQFEYTRELIRREGLEGRCEVRLQDYRDIPGRGVYDRISSVGMFEHVGRHNLRTYFSRLCERLADDGLVMNQGITAGNIDGREVGFGAGDFIERYVFPGGQLEHLSLVTLEIERAGLEVADVESLRRHYADTCRAWAERLEANREAGVRIVGERRYRIWSIYLMGCAYAFSRNWINLYQILCNKKGESLESPLPMTRDYVYGGR